MRPLNISNAQRICVTNMTVRPFLLQNCKKRDVGRGHIIFVT